nr:hypothetical protein GCM10020092_055180 [Actinoplanes digitatis]
MLCRFTAFVAVDSRVVNEGGETRRVTQPVEAPSGWDMFASATLEATPLAVSPPPFALADAAAPPPAPGGAGDRAQGAHRTGALRGDAGERHGVRPRSAAPRRTRAPDWRWSTSGPSSRSRPYRLRDAEGRPARERRDLLADLASWLGALIEGVPGDGLKGLRDLVERLRADGGLEEKWALARATLEAFASPPEHKAFWKR